MARTRQSKTRRATKESVSRRAPTSNPGWFKKGTSGNPAGNPEAGKLGGAPPKRERFRDRLRYRLEEPKDKQLDVSFTHGDAIARRMIAELEDVESPAAYISASKQLVETAYGTKLEHEDVTPKDPNEVNSRLAVLLGIPVAKLGDVLDDDQER